MSYKYDTPEAAYIEAQHRITIKTWSSGDKWFWYWQRSDELSFDLMKLGLTAIPPEITQLTYLEVLDLSHNRLTTVPLEITQLTNLTHLYLYDNQLMSVPPEITRLKNLTHLRLDGNQLTLLPPEIANLTQLRHLNLSNNRLTVLPSEIANLTNLKMLDLRGNLNLPIPPEFVDQPFEPQTLVNYLQALECIKKAKDESLTELNLGGLGLTAVPPEITQLMKLEVLDLRGNPDLPIPPEIVDRIDNAQTTLNYLRALERIKEVKNHPLPELNLEGLGLMTVPPEVVQLTNLQVLRLGENQLAGLPELALLLNLERLDLNSNQLTAVPPEISQLTRLKILNLSDNKLTIVPHELAQLRNLKELDLSGNQFASIPPEISQLRNLETLWLNYNQLSTVPPELAQLTNLQELWLDVNQLTAIPLELSRLTNLKRLFLSENQLTTIPLEITQLTNLRELSLNANKLTNIPLEITQLTHLKYLDLRNNQLTAVPSELAQLTNLQLFYLKGNPDLPIPPEIVVQANNPQVILDYLREKQIRMLNEAKLILVGQGDVGKTSLAKRLLGAVFNEHEDQTKGISIEHWQLEIARPAQGRVPIALNIWDFGGQEIMHATHQFFLTERSLYLLVIDARQGEDEGRLEYWLSLINSFAADAPVLIVINKIDQQRLNINRRGLQKKYPAIKGFVSTSARTGEGIDQLKNKIAIVLAEMPHIDTPFPASWQRIKEELTTMQATRHFLPYREYETICQERGVEEESAQRTLVRFLHDLGIVLNFQDDPRVRETSVLNPHWVTDGVYTILNDPTLQKQHGILRRGQLAVILPSDKYPPSQHRFLLDMMRKFELAYEMDWDSLLIPDLIAKEEPEFAWNDEDALQFAYQYHVLPRSILHRFMVRQYHLVDPEIRWRTGVMLRHSGLSTLVKADIKAATIRIAIKGAGDRRQFLYSLRLTFAGIHESITGIQPKEVVPIPGHPEAPPLLYSYLEKLEARNMPDEQLFPGMDEVFSVQQLLNGVTTTAMRQSGLPSRSQIFDALRTYFNEGEFDRLLFALDVDRDDLAGKAVNDQKRECVLYMERNGRLAELVQKMKESRPNLDFQLR